ncbi:hypothetical protein KIL84_000119 [Mauremys mutica]|uniref:Uncharacterized protein n=1 Tax=Mauremys mutica TaxID=74926 RepID=A0A9D3XF86_9SAUR|nr:hypothetical protein KIL84_000119 [Mauremys mutica]
MTSVPLQQSAGNVTLRVSPSTPVERLSQIRRRRKRTCRDVFQEILQASGASDTEHKAWRITLVDRMDRDRVERRKAKEKERDMQQEMLALLKQETEMLETLVDLQVQQICARLPLQPIDSCIPGPRYTHTTHSQDIPG